jgi:TonB family protein
MLRAITCAATVFLATTFASAQEVRSTVGPLEQSAKPSSPENPIPRRTASAQPVAPMEFRLPANRGQVRLQVTLNTQGRIGEIRQLGEPLVQFNAGTAVDEKTRRPMSDAIVRSAAEALRHWAYEPPAAPVTFHVVFTFYTAPEPTAVQQDPSPLSSLSARGTGAFTPPPPWPAAEGAYRAGPGGGVPPLRQTKNVRPRYPDEAQRRRIGGAVMLEALIGPDGKVKDVRVIQSTPPFDEAAIDAVRQWEFEPTRIDGKAVSVVTTTTVTFTIQ